MVTAPLLYKQLPWERIHTGDKHERPGQPHLALTKPDSDQGLAHFQLGVSSGPGPISISGDVSTHLQIKVFRPNQQAFDDHLLRASHKRTSPFLEEAGLLEG